MIFQSTTKKNPMKSFKILNNLFCLTLLFLLPACGVEEKPTIKESIRPVKFSKIIMSGDALSETFSGTAQSSKESKSKF